MFLDLGGLLSPELTQMLACGLIDYCNAVLHDAPNSTMQKQQQVQHSMDCASGVEVIQCPAIIAPAVLAANANPAMDHIQVGSSDVQGSQHVQSGLPTPSNHRTWLQLNSSFICHPAADLIKPLTGKTFCFLVFVTICLEHAAINSFDQWLSVFKSRLKIFFIPSGFYRTPI